MNIPWKQEIQTQRCHDWASSATASFLLSLDRLIISLIFSHSFLFLKKWNWSFSATNKTECNMSNEGMVIFLDFHPERKETDGMQSNENKSFNIWVSATPSKLKWEKTERRESDPSQFVYYTSNERIIRTKTAMLWMIISDNDKEWQWEHITEIKAEMTGITRNRTLCVYRMTSRLGDWLFACESLQAVTPSHSLADKQTSHFSSQKRRQTKVVWHLILYNTSHCCLSS